MTRKVGEMGFLSDYVPIERATSWVSRASWFVLFALPTAVLITAWFLTPDPQGHSTHMQLGLPACGFLLITGLPCPGCGLTTSFANMMELNIVNAVMANPFGVLLFLVSFTTIFVAAVGFVKNLQVIETLDRLHFEKWAILLAVSSMLVWGVRIATQLSHS